MEQLAPYIRSIPDFPKPGIVFRDITPLVGDPGALRSTVDALTAPYRQDPPDRVAGMEARGFIFGALVAQALDVGFVPLRKPGKLPYDVQSHSYDLEYGSGALEVHVDAVAPGQKVLLVDDLLATGGTAAASCALVEGLGAHVVGCAFVIELDGLGGRDRLAGRALHVLLHF